MRSITDTSEVLTSSKLVKKIFNDQHTSYVLCSKTEPHLLELSVLPQ